MLDRGTQRTEADGLHPSILALRPPARRGHARAAAVLAADPLGSDGLPLSAGAGQRKPPSLFPNVTFTFDKSTTYGTSSCAPLIFDALAKPARFKAFILLLCDPIYSIWSRLNHERYGRWSGAYNSALTGNKTSNQFNSGLPKLKNLEP